MTDLTTYLLYLVPPLVVYALVLVVLQKKGLLGEGKPAALLMGCILMIKTVRGRTLIDRVGQRFRRGWNVFADTGIVLGLLGMVIMFSILAWGAYRTTSIPSSSRPGLNEALAIPGLNPLLPLGYGLLALIVAVVLHELCHGVVARANGIGVKSLGVLLLVIPLGAFVEQDEKEMTQASARKRDRVAAAGIMANFVLALLLLMLMGALLTTSVHVKADGVGVIEVIPGTPAANTSATMGAEGLAPGDIITSVNNTATPTTVQLEAALKGTSPGTTVPVVWFSQATQGLVEQDITLSAAIHYPSVFAAGTDTNASISFLGIGETPITPTQLVGILSEGPAAPNTGAILGTNSVLASSVLFLSLPITQEVPVQGVMSQFYTVSGPLGLLGSGNGWILINALYYIAWVSLILGIFNALPAVPLDGSFLFRDVVGGFVGKLKPAWTAERRDYLTGVLCTAATLLVFALILWEIFAP